MPIINDKIYPWCKNGCIEERVTYGPTLKIEKHTKFWEFVHCPIPVSLINPDSSKHEKCGGDIILKFKG